MEVVISVPLLERVDGGGGERAWTRSFSPAPRNGMSHHEDCHVDQGYKNPVGLLARASHTNFMLPCKVSAANYATQ
jgi:hypothetical protein